MDADKARDALQAMLDGMSARWQRERAESQMTLGALIVWLEQQDPEAMVTGLGEADSYRGYYSDLAFEPTASSRTVADLLSECRKAMGAKFEGYKGGDFWMNESTPLWVASYGCCGPRLMGMSETAPFHPITADEPPFDPQGGA